MPYEEDKLCVSDLDTLANNYTTSLLKQALVCLSLDIEYCLDCKPSNFCDKHLELIYKKMHDLGDDLD